jgi:predicted permease
LFWSAILRLALQGCLEISLGMMISLEQLEWNNWSDIFDSIFSIMCVPAMAALPIWVFIFLKKN